MSSRFVPAGSDQAPISSNDGWEQARQEVESRRAVKAAEADSQSSGKSLYDVLQANKAAKDEAFEEASKLRNQFRPLDDSEVDFLESVRQSERAKEEVVKQETAEQLDQFRKHRTAAEQAVIDLDKDVTSSNQPSTEVSWTSSKKRRRAKADENISLIKPKRSSIARQVESTDTNTAKDTNGTSIPALQDTEPMSSPVAKEVVKDQKTPTGVGGLGLIAYDSDED